MGVAGITGDEDPWMTGIRCRPVEIVEPVGQPLTDFIDRPPDGFLHIEFIGMENIPRGVDQIGLGDVPVACAFALGQRFHLDIDPCHIATFTRDDQQGATASGLDQCLLPDIGKAGDSKDVHDPPGLICGISLQLEPNGVPDRASRAITANDITCPHRCGNRVGAIAALFDVDFHRMRRVIINHKVQNAASVVRFKPCRHAAHAVEIHVMDACLIQDHMRHFGQAVLDILNPPGTDDVLRVFRVGFPECRFIDPIGLVAHPMRKTEGLKHLH